MESEGSLPYSYVPATCPYPELARSSPYPHFLKLCVNLQHGHYCSLTALNLQPTANQEWNDQCGNQHCSRELLMMGIVVPETCLVYKKYNKIISLFFSYHNDARSNKHQISSTCLFPPKVSPLILTCSIPTSHWSPNLVSCSILFFLKDAYQVCLLFGKVLATPPPFFTVPRACKC